MVITFISSESRKLTWIMALLLILVMMIQVHGQSGNTSHILLPFSF
jgi:hypothetical protein